MSRRALMLATVDLLRSAGSADPPGFGLGQAECELMMDGEPPARYGASGGKVFVAVHAEGRQNQQVQNALDEVYSFSVTATMRLGVAPDLVGPKQLAVQGGGFFDWVDSLRRFLHMNYDVLNRANLTYIQPFGSGGTVYGFSEPPAFLGDDTPRWVGPSWFKATQASGLAPLGVAQTLRFGRARREQPNGNLQL